jgi:choline kinase
MARSAVVLAAGRGSRLGVHTDDLPKCLVPVGGQPLIHYALSSLAEAGIERVIVVAGYRKRQLVAALNGSDFGIELTIATNPNYELGNASSLASALPWTDEPFILTMADHIVSPELFRTLLYAAPEGDAIAIDRSVLSPERLAEATKIATVGGFVSGLGKDLIEWDGADTGVSCWNPASFAALGGSAITGELAAVMTQAARLRSVLPVDVSGCFWLDVDTPDDIREAERGLGADAGLPV